MKNKDGKKNDILCFDKFHLLSPLVELFFDFINGNRVPKRPRANQSNVRATG